MSEWPRNFSTWSGIEGLGPFAPPVRRGVYRAGLKRALDVTLVLLALPAVLPIIVVCAIVVAVGGGQPFYGQVRVGRGGRFFRMWKLRTMVVDADRKLESHLAAHPAARAEWNRSQKLRKDPRVTRFGRFLRRTSLDELPQLWNVLRGDMSLVGPRPMLPEQRALYPGLAYFALRPGLTGPWQVTERNASSFAVRAEHDDSYNRTLSFGGDVRILAATVGVVLRCTGI